MCCAGVCAAADELRAAFEILCGDKEHKRRHNGMLAIVATPVFLRTLPHVQRLTWRYICVDSVSRSNLQAVLKAVASDTAHKIFERRVFNVGSELMSMTIPALTQLWKALDGSEDHQTRAQAV